MLPEETGRVQKTFQQSSGCLRVYFCDGPDAGANSSDPSATNPSSNAISTYTTAHSAPKSLQNLQR